MKNKMLSKNGILYSVLFLISIISYQVVYGLKTLDPSNINWLLSVYHDWGQHYLGWAYYRETEWSFPLGKMNNFYYPIGTNVGFTDSIPLLAFVFKIFNFLLPEDFQYFGIWLWSCMFLNAFYTCKILKLFKANNLIIYFAVVLVITNPVFIFRGMHPALCAHWLILGSIYYYLVPTTKENALSNYKKQGLLFFLSSTINPYLAFMLAGFTIVLSIKNYCYENSITLKQVFLFPVLSISSGLLFWLIFGLLEFNKATNLDVGNIYGLYGFNLNSFYNSYGHFSKFIPHLGMVTDQQHEGFGYLGLGLLVLSVVSVFLFLFFLFTKKINKNHLYLLPLVLFCSLMLVFAITNIVTYGNHVLFEYPTLGIVEKLGNIFRANGRFSWPFYYLLIIGSILLFSKLKWSLYLKYFAFMGLTFFQIYDIENLLTSRDLKHGSFDSKLNEKQWKFILDNFDEIITYPPYSNNMVYNMDYQDLMFVALKSRKPISIGYVARENVIESNNYKEKIYNQIKAGKIFKNQIFVTNSSNLDDFDVLIYKNKVNLKRLDNFILVYSTESNFDSKYYETYESKSFVDSVLQQYKFKYVPKTLTKAFISQDQIQFNVESFDIEDNVVQVNGWAFLKNSKNQLSDSIFVSLLNEKNRYLFSTTTVKRKDINTAFKNDNLENSGFKTTFFTDNIPQEKYDFAIIIKDKNENYHVNKTSFTVNLNEISNKVPELVTSLPKQLKILNNIEKIEITHKKIILSGWAALENTNSENKKISILLLSPSKKYKLETELVLRNDVTSYFKNNYNYDNSGFILDFNIKMIPKGTYDIGILIKDGISGRESYVLTDKKVKI